MSQEVAVLKEQLLQAHENIRALRAEVSALKAEDPQEKMSWMQVKCDRQKRALRRLNNRVVAQRFVLALINENGRGLTQEEWESNKDRRPFVEKDESLFAPV